MEMSDSLPISRIEIGKLANFSFNFHKWNRIISLITTVDSIE